MEPNLVIGSHVCWNSNELSNSRLLCALFSKEFTANPPGSLSYFRGAIWCQIFIQYTTLRSQLNSRLVFLICWLNLRFWLATGWAGGLWLDDGTGRRGQRTWAASRQAGGRDFRLRCPLDFGGIVGERLACSGGTKTRRFLTGSHGVWCWWRIGLVVTQVVGTIRWCVFFWNGLHLTLEGAKKLLTHWPLGDLNAILKMEFSILFYWLVSSDLLMIMPSNEWHRTLLMISQHWLR